MCWRHSATSPVSSHIIRLFSDFPLNLYRFSNLIQEAKVLECKQKPAISGQGELSPRAFNMSYSTCLSVVIPAYNEESTIATVVGKVLTIPSLLEIVIVDDCSTDRTPKITLQLAKAHSQIRLTRHVKNAGKTEGA